MKEHESCLLLTRAWYVWKMPRPGPGPWDWFLQTSLPDGTACTVFLFPGHLRLPSSSCFGFCCFCCCFSNSLRTPHFLKNWEIHEVSRASAVRGPGSVSIPGTPWFLGASSCCFTAAFPSSFQSVSTAPLVKTHPPVSLGSPSIAWPVLKPELLFCSCPWHHQERVWI